MMRSLMLSFALCLGCPAWASQDSTSILRVEALPPDSVPYAPWLGSGSVDVFVRKAVSRPTHDQNYSESIRQDYLAHLKLRGTRSVEAVKARLSGEASSQGRLPYSFSPSAAVFVGLDAEGRFKHAWYVDECFVVDGEDGLAQPVSAGVLDWLAAISGQQISDLVPADLECPALAEER